MTNNSFRKGAYALSILVVLVLGAALVYQGGEISKLKANNNQGIGRLSTRHPDQSLRSSFEDAKQHSAMADIAELACFPSSRFDCSSESCLPNAPASYYFVDYGTETGTYFRCDSKGCDSYPVKVVPSGVYTQFTPATGQAMFFKVASDDTLGNKGEFIDIATLGTSSLVSFGKCE